MAERTYTLLVKGQRITVTKAQYKAYHQERERERYLDRVARDYERSMEQFREDGVQSVERQLVISTPGPEEIACREEMCATLYACIAQLPNQEQELLHSLYFEGLSERQLSAVTGVPQKTINNRRQKTLKKLRKMMDK